jgi:capsular polysaccharide transport system permease protein
MLRKDFAIQRRVIGALMMREMYTRFGRDNLGFAWVFAEPLVFALPVIGLWSLIRARYEHGVGMVPLIWSGYLPILLFRHCGSYALFLVRANAGLLYHARVTVFDIFLARMALEIGGNLAALGFSFVLLYALGAMEPLSDVPMFYLGYFFMIWWSVAVALIIGALSERSEVVEKVWSPISYMYLIISGFLFMAAWLPDSVREWALLMPFLQAYEMIRAGIFGSSVRTYGDPGYEALILAVLTVIGLLLMRDAKKYVALE